MKHYTPVDHPFATPDATPTSAQGCRNPGTKCLTCGWLGPAGRDRCPVDETALDAVDNILEPAVRAAIQQSAAVHVVRAQDGEEPLAPFSEPIAAQLRY